MRRPPVAVVVGLVAFANAAVWALVTPAFQGPDEDAHVAYAVHLAETGHTPTAGSKGNYASSEMALALGAVNHYSVIQFPQTRPPWRKADQREFESRVAAEHPRRDDGGGGESIARVHAPAYYAFPALAYRIAGGSFFSRLFAMRIASAFLSAFTAVFVLLTMRELLPRPRWPAVCAGLLVAFQPMFGFVSGTVTTDVGVDLAGAALLFFLVRALRRGLRPGTAVGISLSFVLGVLAKATMLAFAPVVAVTLAILLRRRAGTLRSWALLGGTFVAAALAWVVVAHAIGRPVLPLPEAGPSHGGAGIGGTLSYLWQRFLPPLPFMTDLYNGPAGGVPAWATYVQRVWGTFGWLSINYPEPVFQVVGLIVLAAIVLAVRAGLRERTFVRERRAELSVLALGFLAVALFMHLAFASVAPGVGLEQGRYLFQAITPAALVAVAACYGLGRRWAPVGGTVLVGAMMLFSAFSQLFVLTRYYT